MSVICEVSYDEAKNYIGKNVSAKIGNKKQKVYFKLNCDDLTLKESINLVKNNKNFICLNYIGLTDNTEYKSLDNNLGIYMIRVTELGNNITDADVQNVINETPKGVVPIIKLPEDFSDLRKIWEFSSKYPRVRFCGGDLFNCDGCRLGCCSVELMKSLGINEKITNYNKIGCACFCDVYDFEDLDLVTTKMTSTPKRSAPSGDSKPKKEKVSFASLMKANPLSI